MIDKCNKYECLFPLYRCDVIPSEWFGDGNTVPSETTAEPEQDYIPLDLPNYDCNVIAEARINPDYTDTDNYMNYSVQTIEWFVTDKCLVERNNPDHYISYAYSCVSDDTAELEVFESADCSGDSTIGKTLKSGEIEGDYWYYVDCSNDDDRDNEIVNDYDNSDCDIIYRLWFAEDWSFDDTIDGYEYNCIYNFSTATYYDFGVPAGACKYIVLSNTFLEYILIG